MPTETSLSRAVEADIVKLADWIADCREAQLISNLGHGDVRREHVQSWLDEGLTSCVLRAEGQPVVFGTLSIKEAPLPAAAVEICHVIVHPRCRRQFKGTQVVAELMQSARALGFQRVVGRVEPSNAASHGFLAWLRWKPTLEVAEDQPGQFVWYERAIRP